jgi:hypothetical protein
MAISLTELRDNRRNADRMFNAMLAETRGDRRALRDRLAAESRRLIGSRNDADQSLGVLLLNAAGYEIQQDAAGKLIAKHRSTDERGDTVNQDARRPQFINPGDGGGLRDDGWSRGMQQRRIGERQNELILTPESSNVHSFTWYAPGNPGASNEVIGTLYVTFKAPTLNSENVIARKNQSGWKELRGRAGKTVTGKSGDAGVTYAYYRVPRVVFERMKKTASKGKFVWSNLRVRGTIYGHRYQYGVVQGAVMEHGGEQMEYVPRKATQDGFRKRAVADITQRGGRRGFVTSTLPEKTYLRRSGG